MKIINFLIMLVLLVSCQEQLNNLPDVENGVEKLDFTTYSENTYIPEFEKEYSDSLVQVKVKKDSTRSNAKRNIFQGIIKRLDLDSSQKMIVDSLIFEHQNCIQSCISSVKLEERRILDSSKKVIDSIKIQLDSGLIRRLDARIKISEINKSTKASIAALNERLKVKECVENCDAKFISEFSKVLNPIQLKKFNDWLFVNKLPKDKKKGRG